MPIPGLCRAGSRVSDEITPYSAGCADCQDSNAVDSRGLIRRARPIEGVISSQTPGTLADFSLVITTTPSSINSLPAVS